MRRAAYFSLAIVGLLAFASLAMAATIGVVVTSTVTAQCTGTATLPDGSPSGLTTTFVAPCTGTFTYTSTSTLPTTSASSVSSSTSTTSSGTLGNEMVQEIYNTTVGLKVSNFGVRWSQGASPMNKDQWGLMWVISDSVDGLTLVACVTSMNGTHAFELSEYSGSTLIGVNSAPIPDQASMHPTMVNTQSPNINDFGNNEGTVFYYGPGGGFLQFFWYGPFASLIAFAYNMNVPKPLPIITSTFGFFTPEGQPTLVFAPGFNIQMQLMQDEGSKGESFMQYGVASLAGGVTPAALATLNGLQSNLCENILIVTQPTPGQTSFPSNLGLTMSMNDA